MNIMNAFESLYKYLFSVNVYTKAMIAGYVGKTIDEKAYKEITGDDYVAPSA
ncbi:XkdX family protein [Lactobacillus sp. ESL0261]|uniref:XkdX family protein n=1 Tax=Lactobacillus sp. ESL0261 TaxID=2069348 RepID=UPI001F1E2BF1|nr:XkdX family protein [Lactobacillus sp. ESL0261]